MSGSRPPGHADRPWVVVVGAHRSGTSAITGALVALGLQGVDPGDRMEWEASNPHHWESLAAALFDDELLSEGGGTWDAPPPAGWAPEVDRHRDQVDSIMAAAYPEATPPVWKDPRASLLLPFWREVLPEPLTAVLVWRDPRSVAESLHRRDGMPIDYGVALWERYVRSAIAGLSGVDTYVLEYSSTVADPAGSLRGIASWLGGLERFAPWAGAWDVTAAAASIDPQLRHHEPEPSGSDETAGLSTETRELVSWLRHHAGGHSPLEADLPPSDTSMIEAMLAGGRAFGSARTEGRKAHAEAARLDAEVARLDAEVARLDADVERITAHERDLERQLREGYQTEIERLIAEIDVVRRQERLATAELERMQASRSWKMTAPLRAAERRPKR